MMTKSTLDKNFDGLVKETLESWNTPGCAVAVVDAQNISTKVIQGLA